MIYVDLSCDRISGQQIMQRHLRERVIERGLYSSFEESKYLVYVQIPLDFDTSIWKKAKEQGKKIIFIHHYFRDFERYAIFMNQEAFDLVDLHIIHGADCELYKYMIEKNKHFLLYDQAAIDYENLNKKYFTKVNIKENSICYVGRFSKGVDHFIEFCNKHSFDKKSIFCAMTPNKYHLLDDKRLLNFDIYLNKTNDDLYKEFTKHKFLYVNYDLIASPNHFEMTMLEAMSMGVIVILGDMQKKYIHIDSTQCGFIDEVEFESQMLDNVDLSSKQTKQFEFLKNNFLSLNKLMDKNIENILLL